MLKINYYRVTFTNNGRTPRTEVKYYQYLSTLDDEDPNTRLLDFYMDFGSFVELFRKRKLDPHEDTKDFWRCVMECSFDDERITEQEYNCGTCKKGNNNV